MGLGGSIRDQPKAVVASAITGTGLCQDGNTSSHTITEVKHLELNQFSDGSNSLGSGKCCCRMVRNMGCPFEIPFSLGPVHLVHHKATFKKKPLGNNRFLLNPSSFFTKQVLKKLALPKFQSIHGQIPKILLSCFPN